MRKINIKSHIIIREAHEQKICLLEPMAQGPFWGEKTEEQKIILNNLINRTNLNMRNMYSRKITSGLYS